jgi:hypothetical protein
MNTYFAYDIQTSDGKRSLVMSDAPTFEECKSKAIKDSNYYVGECGYNVRIVIEERCSECHNQGYVIVYGKRNKLIGKKVKCNTCKGKFPHNPVILYHSSVLNDN